MFARFSYRKKRDSSFVVKKSCSNFFHAYFCQLASVYEVELKWKLREGLFGKMENMLYFLKYQRLLNCHVNSTRKDLHTMVPRLFENNKMYNFFNYLTYSYVIFFCCFLFLRK